MYIKYMILDLIFPKFCVICKKLGHYICQDCRKQLTPYKNEYCHICNEPSFIGLNHFNCYGDLDGVFSFFEYKGSIKKVIKSIKYSLIFSVWKELFCLLPTEAVDDLKKFKKQNNIAYLQKIPLHETRLKQRGFNQVDPLESYIADILGYKKIDMLKRIKATSPQAQMNGKKERKENMLGAFTLKNETIKDVPIILIDDVYTTGSTCREAAKMLKEHGASKVYALTFARD